MPMLNYQILGHQCSADRFHAIKVPHLHSYQMWENGRQGIPSDYCLLLFSPFLGQIHSYSPCRQSHPFLLIHSHTWVVPLQKCNVHSLRLHVLNILFCFFDLMRCCAVGRERFANTLLDWRGRRERAMWEFS